MFKAIETVYNGYRFRSRLEARWAVFFDKLGVKYEYEKEGYQLGYIKIGKPNQYIKSETLHYLPDFWLPNVGDGCWVEIKGKALNDEEVLKAGLLAYHSGQWVNVFQGSVGEHSVSAFLGLRPPRQIASYARQAIKDNQFRLFRLLTASNEVYWGDIRKEAFEMREWKNFGGARLPYRHNSNRIICFCPNCKNLSFGYAETTIEEEERHHCNQCGVVSKQATGKHFTWPGLGQCFHCKTMMDEDEPHPGYRYINNDYLKAAYTAARQARFEHGE